MSRWEFWRLPLADRRRVLRAVRTGVFSGDYRLDRMAVHRLTEQMSRANRIALPVLAALVLVVIAVAALRQSGW